MGPVSGIIVEGCVSTLLTHTKHSIFLETLYLPSDPPYPLTCPISERFMEKGNLQKLKSLESGSFVDLTVFIKDSGIIVKVYKR